ncbi:MAG: Hsp20/alpha crystallin family protein [Candidatus Acetothermia bacterium]
MPFPTDRNRRRNRIPSPFSTGGFLDDLFQDLENSFFGSSLGRLGNTDIYEEDGTLHYELELPGLTKDQIRIQAGGDELIVSGEIEEEQEKEDVNYISRGRRYGKFKRSLPLPEEVEDPEKLKARFENGVLHIEAELHGSLGKGGTVDVEIE